MKSKYLIYHSRRIYDIIKHNHRKIRHILRYKKYIFSNVMRYNYQEHVFALKLS
jgi:hypothetical protein